MPIGPLNCYPHMCRDEHVEIGHADNSSEMCPLCRAISERDSLAEVLAAAEKERDEAVALLRELAQRVDDDKSRTSDYGTRDAIEYPFPWTTDDENCMMSARDFLARLAKPEKTP